MAFPLLNANVLDEESTSNIAVLAADGNFSRNLLVRSSATTHDLPSVLPVPSDSNNMIEPTLIGSKHLADLPATSQESSSITPTITESSLDSCALATTVESSSLVLPIRDVLSIKSASAISSITDQCMVCSDAFKTDRKGQFIDSLGCYACDNWYHHSCTGMSINNYKSLISLGDAVEWFCPTCTKNKKTGLYDNIFPLGSDADHNCKSAAYNQFSVTASTTGTGTSINSTSELSSCIRDLASTVALLASQNITTIEAVKNLSTKVDAIQTQKNSFNPSNNMPKNVNSIRSSNKLTHTYSEIVKLVAQNKNGDNNVHTKSNTAGDSIHNMKTTLVLVNANKEKCGSKSLFMFEFSKMFPKVKILSSSLKSSGLIFLTFENEQDTKIVFENWKADYFGSKTKVSYLHSNNNHVILKNIITSFSEAEIKNEVTEQYPSCHIVQRFITNGKPLPVVKITFSSNTDSQKNLQEGVFIGNLFIKPEKYNPPKQPTRGFNCKKFGHTANFCKSNTCCARCSGCHKTSDCNANDTNTTLKCPNCNDCHSAFEKKCPVFLEHFKKVNFL